jgi:hypothetical protein
MITAMERSGICATPSYWKRYLGSGGQESEAAFATLAGPAL